MSAIGGKTNLIFTLPMLNILNVASATYIDILSRFDNHVICRDDISDRRLTRIVSCDPKSDRNIIGCITKGNRKKTVEAEKELGAAVVEC